MKDYINYVISVINPDGEEINLPASKKMPNILWFFCV